MESFLGGADSLITTVPWNLWKKGCFQWMTGIISALWLFSWEKKPCFSSATCIRRHRGCIAASVPGSSRALLAASTWWRWDRLCPWDRSAAWVTLVVRPNRSLGAALCTDAHHFSVRITNGSRRKAKWPLGGGHRFDRRELPFVVTFFLEYSGGAVDFRQQILVKAPQLTGWLRTRYGTLLVVWEWHQLPLLTHKVCKGHVGNMESAMKI